MDKVYIAQEYNRGEGTEIIGIFSTLELAEKAVEELCLVLGYEKRSDGHGGLTYSMRSYPSYEITEVEINHNFFQTEVTVE